MSEKKPYVNFREDGWPLCPGCGEDELYSLAIPATIETIQGCYRCPWPHKDRTVPLRLNSEQEASDGPHSASAAS